MNSIGEKNMLDLLNVQRADSLSKQDFCRERLKKTDYQERAVREIIENGECYRRKDLAVNGNDIRELDVYKRQVHVIVLEIVHNQTSFLCEPLSWFFVYIYIILFNVKI